MRIRSRPVAVRWAALFLLQASVVACASAADDQRPNIVVILSDDMGYSDLGCYGGEIRTPHLDRFARGGLRFTQFYNTARCCPTRAALLTGLYSHQAGIGHMTGDKGFDAYRGELSPHCVTIAEALRPAGYRNYAVGKWHVTRSTAPDAPNFNRPLQRGFDRFYGTIGGAGSFFDPSTLMRDETAISAFSDPEYQPQRYYYTHALSDQAVRFVDEHRRDRADKPFFLYLAYTAAHWPMHALEEDIARYRGRYDVGYDAIRKARFARMKQLNLIGPEWRLSETAGDWDAVKNKEWEARCMEVYAAMVDAMDQGIGRLTAKLSEVGQLDNTLIFYLQDNGGCAETIGRDGDTTRRQRPASPPIARDGLRQDVIPKQERAGAHTLTGSSMMPGPADTFIAYGRGWANVSNTPFREYKHWEHEGGISTPLIVHWPRGIPSERRESLEKQPGHLIDLMATCLDVAGAAYPNERQGRKLTPLAGVSLRPAFQGRSVERKQPLFWEHEGNCAIRDDRWKLVRKHGEPWELYDLEADRTEQRDLAATQPNRVQQMRDAWQAWADRVGVQPWPLDQPKPDVRESK